MKLDVEKIKEIYGNQAIYELKENLEDVIYNMNTLANHGFTDIYDIVEKNPYLFTKPTDIFEEYLEKLIQKLGVNFIEKLENDNSLWGEIND